MQAGVNMKCDRFLRQLEVLADCEMPPDEYEEHALACAACRRKLARARSLASLLRSLPPSAPPPDLRSKVQSAARRRPVHSLRLLRVAAAILVLVGATSAVLLLGSQGLSYEPLDLTVLPMAENGPSDEEHALEVMYGPGIPIGESARKGSGGEDHRAGDR